jgi:ribosome-associated translation inhibitor RaiA
MKLEVTARGVRISHRLRRHIDRKLRVAFGRFVDRVRQVHIRLEDVNGPRGGDDIVCCIRASLSPGGDLAIRETRCDPYAAVARAAARAGHRLSRTVKQLHTRRLGRMRLARRR